MDEIKLPIFTDYFTYIRGNSNSPNTTRSRRIRRIGRLRRQEPEDTDTWILNTLPQNPSISYAWDDTRTWQDLLFWCD